MRSAAALSSLASIAEIAAEPHLDPGIRGGEAVHLPRQVVLDVARGEQHPRAPRRCAWRPRAASAASAVADRRPGEFEIAGGEIVVRQARAQAPPRRARTRRSPRGRGCRGRTACTAVRSSPLPVAHALISPTSAPAMTPAGACTIRCCCCSAASRRRGCSATCRRCSASCRIRWCSPAARSPPSTASSTGRAQRSARRVRGIVTVLVLVGAAAGLGWVHRTRCAGPRCPAAVVEVLLIARPARAAQPVRPCRAPSAMALAAWRLAGRARGGQPYRRPRPGEPRRTRRRARGDRKPRREFQRRRRRAGLLVSGRSGCRGFSPTRWRTRSTA